MNRFFLASLTCLLTLLFTLPALAIEDDVITEEPPQEPVTVETQVEDKNIIVNVTLPAVSPAPTEELPPAEGSTPPPQTFSPFSAYALDVPPETSPETIPAVVTALFGEYTPRTQTVTDRLSDGTTVTYTQVIPGLAGLDYPWLASVGLFSLLLYGFLRLIGGLIKL